MAVTVGAAGKIEQLSMREEHLKGTLFEKELLPPIAKSVGGPDNREYRGTCW